ncbi:hypothetical protein AAG906_038506 [Vitis piasezkii]
MMADKLDMATNNNVSFKAKAHTGEKINPIFYNMHNCLFYNMKFVLCLYRLMDTTNRIYCYIFVGGKLVQKNDGQWEYVGGRSKGIHIYKGMPFEEFTKKIFEKFDISFDAMKMHYTLKFNPRVIQDLEDEDDLDNVVSHSDDFANIYLVDLPCVEAIEANISNTELAIGGPPATFPSSNASCDAIPNTMMLSRGFASRCADSEYTLLESIRFREAILGLGHTFKNAEEFCNAIYHMSLGGRFEYKYKKNSPMHMSVKCSVEGCPWKITTHAVEGNVILRVHTYQMCLEPLQTIFPVKFVRILNMVMELREINLGTIAEYTSHEGHFMQLFIAHAFSIQGFIMGCRPVLAIDSCHLSGPYKGALLSAIAYDANDGMFPLALAVVSLENYEEWYWFLEKLKGVLDGKEVVIISDRHQGILRSVSELFVTGNHAYCYRHVKANFSSFLNKQNIRGKKGKEDALLLLDNITYARLEIDYNEAFEKLVRFNDNLAKWVAENNPKCQSFFKNDGIK